MKLCVLFFVSFLLIFLLLAKPRLARLCGSRITDSGHLKRIVGGRASEQGAWPWQVALLFKGKQNCGGSLISSTWLVTAAHCFTSEILTADPNDWSATLGEHHLGNREVFEQRRSVDKIILHPLYRYEGDESRVPPYYDIALVKLTTPANLTVHVWPICLLGEDTLFSPGKECVTTGWGHTRPNGQQPDTIREARVWLIPRHVCNSPDSYQGRVHDLGLCADVPEDITHDWAGSPCNFDSGGPLACAYGGRYYLAGVTSWSEGDCGSMFHVFANMWQLTGWVRQIVKSDRLKR